MTEIQYIAGMDEVGRGCLAGPVFAAAVVLPRGFSIPNLRDSKKLSAKQRVRADQAIKEQAVAWSIGRAEVPEIDQVNILHATFLAMRRAISGLGVPVHCCRVDGNQDPGLPVATELVVGGDDLDPSIMAASILAKVARDQEMQDLESLYPGYDFARNKGYGTAAHMIGLQRLGPCDIHRMSFAPCRLAQDHPLARDRA